jgi:hypothetical protein
MSWPHRLLRRLTRYSCPSTFNAAEMDMQNAELYNRHRDQMRRGEALARIGEWPVPRLTPHPPEILTEPATSHRDRQRPRNRPTTPPLSSQYCQYTFRRILQSESYTDLLQQRHRKLHTHPPNMSHESVWYSRPRTYGKGSREWYVFTYPELESTR